MRAPALAFPDAIRLHGRYLAGRPALTGEVDVTFGELDALVAGVAAWAEQYDLVGRRVALTLPPDAAHLVLILGLLGAGVTVCPVNTRLTDTDVYHYLERIEPTLLVTDRPRGFHTEHILTGDPGDPLEDQVPFATGGIHRPVLGETSPAVVFPTGGTTGGPKAALWTHRSLALAVQSSVQHLEVGRCELEVYFSPFFHLTLVTGAFTTMLAGGTVHLTGLFDERRVATALDDQPATRLFGTPAALERLTEHCPPGGWPSVRSVVFGASRSWPDLPERLTTMFPSARLITGYGATEFGAVTRQYHDDITARVAGVGRPVASVEIRAVDDSDRDVAAGEIGELLVRSPWQMDRYLGAGSYQPFDHDGFVRSGDLGRIEPDGRIVLVDRRGDVIKCGGETVYPSDVEQALLGLDVVAEAAVFGRLDRRRGETVEAAIVAAPGAVIDPDAVRQALAGLLASCQVPTRVHLVDRLPLTANLKVDRRTLVEQLA